MIRQDLSKDVCAIYVVLFLFNLFCDPPPSNLDLIYFSDEPMKQHKRFIYITEIIQSRTKLTYLCSLNLRSNFVVTIICTIFSIPLTKGAILCLIWIFLDHTNPTGIL